MSWSTMLLLAVSVISGLIIVEHYYGKSTQERASLKGNQCAIDCDFQGASSYSINLGDERDCICTFKITRKK